jgi:glyceraldehyde 3-phosphate dehydrogenase
MKVGINGFGRIGKSIFIQLLAHPYFKICAINAIKLDIHSIEKYFKRDSTHFYDKNFKINILDENHFEIIYLNHTHKVRLIRERDAEKIEWNVDLLFEASGAYLTTEKCLKHNVPYVIITAPAKDKTSTYVYSVNEKTYKGESVISNASCTTNCMAPFLKFINDHYTIVSSSFTTIHATTASQSILDTPENNPKSSRSSRSIFNNLIPATTGASSAIKAVIPELDGKIQGMALRVPTNNVSVVDIVIETEDDCLKDELFKRLEVENKYKEVMYVEEDELVSTDFITTTKPTILDKHTFLQLDTNKIKILIWYDNEWSYATQTIRMGEVIYNFRKCKESIYSYITEDIHFRDQNVLIRVDYNVPINKNGEITDDFRMSSTIPTIQRILQDIPKRIIIATHFGRPKGLDKKYSVESFVEHLSKLLNQKVYFLKNGISKSTLEEIHKIENLNYMYSVYEMDEYVSPKVLNSNPKIYLLENVRFHTDETTFEEETFDKNNSEVYKIWNQLGSVFVNCAFGCAHRNHLTINGFTSGPTYYDFLIEKELKALQEITENKSGKKILAILGGAKIDDKLPLCSSLIQKVNHIYLGGGIINSYIYNEKHKDFIDGLKPKVSLMKDGYGNSELYHETSYYLDGYHIEKCKYFDIGNESLKELYKCIDENDIIFWNGTLGVTENDLYKNGSIALLNYLMESKKRIIIGGGDTAGFVNQYLKNQSENIHICTGGGASIEYIINGSLVGIQLKK